MVLETTSPATTAANAFPSSDCDLPEKEATCSIANDTKLFVNMMVDIDWKVCSVVETLYLSSNKCNAVIFPWLLMASLCRYWVSSLPKSLCRASKAKNARPVQTTVPRLVSCLTDHTLMDRRSPEAMLHSM